MARRIVIALAIVAYAAAVGYVGWKKAREATERMAVQSMPPPASEPAVAQAPTAPEPTDATPTAAAAATPTPPTATGPTIAAAPPPAPAASKSSTHDTRPPSAPAPLTVKAVDRAAPASPPGLHVVATSERQVAVSWGAATDDVGVATYEVLRGGAVVARLGGTAVTESGLAPAQAYCYVVRAVDASGNASDPAGPVCATTPDLTPPSAPDLLVVEAAGEHAVKARWAPAADDVGVEGYEVVRAGAVTATTAELAAALTGLRPLVEVCLSVRAFDAAGNRSPESRPGCASPPDLTAPTAPRDVVLAAPSEQRMELRWAPSQDEVGVASYEVERGGKAVVTSDGPRASDAGGLTAGQEVCYTIRARDTVGNVSAPSRRACAVMPDLTAPSQPPRFAAAPSSPSNVAFAWDVSTDNVGVAAYELRRGGQVVARLDGNALRASAAGLAPSTNHCFELMAVDRAGNRSAPASACATTAEPGVPAGPTVVRGEAKAPTMVVLKWDSSPDPDVVYTVYWDNGKKIGATSATQYTVAGLRSGERRCYRVAAMDVAGKESPRTIETCVASTPGAAASAK